MTKRSRIQESSCTIRPPATGFTLIELLVVIAVVGLLIGLLAPALARAGRAAESIEALAATRSLMQAYTAYATDHTDKNLPGHLKFGYAETDLGSLTDEEIETDLFRARDEFGNILSSPTLDRWVFRLAPWFDYGWGGTTHVGNQSQMIDEFSERSSPEAGGFGTWNYLVSVFPSFGLNAQYVGGHFGRRSWIDPGHHVTRMSGATDPSGLLVFVSSRFYQPSFSGTDDRLDGHFFVQPPYLDEVFDEEQQTSAVPTRYGYVHPRYEGKAVSSFFDGHASLVDQQQLTDRRFWSNAARKKGDPRWEPD